MASLRRIVVGLQDTCDTPKVADFLTCLVHYFTPNELSTIVNCKLQDDLLVLYSPKRDEHFDKSSEKNLKFGFVTLHHSPECPIWKLQENNTPLTSPNKNGIYVGVAILVESADARVLLTQRPDHMRSFPRAWVPPGGHLEVGETLINGAMRELEEEAGLVLDPSNTSIRLLCLWESVFPPLLVLNEPKNHHVVLYFHAKSKETWQQLQSKIKLDHKEVKACTWLTRENVESLCSGPKLDTEIIQQFVISEDSSTKSEELDLQKMFFTDSWRTGYIYTGSQLVLTKWLESLNEHIPSKI